MPIATRVSLAVDQKCAARRVPTSAAAQLRGCVVEAGGERRVLWMGEPAGVRVTRVEVHLGTRGRGREVEGDGSCLR